jgi:hypothetical protein
VTVYFYNDFRSSSDYGNLRAEQSEIAEFITITEYVLLFALWLRAKSSLI